MELIFLLSRFILVLVNSNYCLFLSDTTGSGMRRARPQIVLRETKQVEYEIPAHLKTSWTSLDAERFSAVTESLKTAFSPQKDQVSNPEEPKEYVLGYKEVLQYIQRSGMNILCVIACTDNGGRVDLTSRIVRNCFLNGIPVVMGRGARELGGAFGKHRVCCAALTKLAASKSEMLDFVMNMSSLTSEVRIPLEESEEIIEQFRAEVSSAMKAKPVKRKEPESAQKKQNAPVDKKPKTPTSDKKKGNFFSSFD